jgi:hypothetical protein
MLIECPNCHRKGNIPDRFGLSPHFIRCRTCLTRFTTVPITVHQETNRLLAPQEELPDDQIVVDLRQPDTSGLSDGTDTDDLEAIAGPRGPGDSHYEWPGISDPDLDDSQVELPAFTDGDDSSSGETPAFAADSSSVEISVINPGHDALTGSRAGYRLAAALLIRTVSLAIFGFFVFEAGRNAHTVGGASAMALVAGCMGLCGLLLLDHDLRDLISRLVTAMSRKQGVRSRPERQTARS